MANTAFITSCVSNNNSSDINKPEIGDGNEDNSNDSNEDNNLGDSNGGSNSDENNGDNGNNESDSNDQETDDFNSVINYDYFVLPNKDSSNYSNRITIPTTKNNEIIKKYGTAPLPWKDDKLITKNDIVNMFTYITIYAKAMSVSFGERKIDTNLFNDAYVEWCNKYWKFFPYKAFDNPPPIFKSISADGKIIIPGGLDYGTLNTNKYINETQWYIFELNWTNYENIFQSGTSREEYIEYITTLFRIVQPNMTDVEKFYLCAEFIMNWIKYCGNMYGPSFNNHGCCADYANMFSLSLQLLDVPAIPLTCGYQAGLHGIVWVYLDLYGNGDKKWYASDLTFGDSGFEPYNGILAVNSWYDAKAWLLFDVAVDQFTSIDTLGSGGRPFQHDISNNLCGAPWSAVGKGTTTIGKISYGTEDNYTYKYFNYFTNPRGSLERSRNFFLNGYTYYFEKNQNAKNQISLYRQKAVIGSQKENVPINLEEKYLNKFVFDYNDENCAPLVQQYGNKIAIILNSKKSSDSNYKRSVLVIETNENGIDWNKAWEFEINSTDLINNYIFNFDIDINGILRIDYGKNQYSTINTLKLNLGEEFVSLMTFNKNNNNRLGDLKIAKDYFSALISMFRTGENTDGRLSISERKDFYNFMEQVDSSIPFDSIKKIYNEYNRVVENMDASTGEMVQSEMLSNLYIKQKDAFNEYGFDFGNLRVFNNPYDMLGESEVKTNYNIYFSSSKPTNSEDLNNFIKVVSDSDKPYVTLKDLEKFNISSGQGYYYIEIEKKGIKIRTNVCYLMLHETESSFIESSLFYYSDSEPSNLNSKITNYNDKIYNWNEDKINFYFEIYYNKKLFPLEYSDLKIELKHINIKTKKITTIKNNEWFNSYKEDSLGRFRGKINLEEVPNENNIGIYYLELTTTNKNTNQKIVEYSDFNFILSSNDFDYWNKNLWIESIELISLFKKNNNFCLNLVLSFF